MGFNSAFKGLIYYPGICPKVLKKTMKTLNHLSRCCDQESNPPVLEYKSQYYRFGSALFMCVT
jgi:hypothetical protein